MLIQDLYRKIFTTWFDEYQNETRYGIKGKLIITEQSNYQKITIIETKKYGKALLLDNCWMTTEKEEKSYHESLVHPALSTAKEIRKVLIIGGGDGGAVRECLLYNEVKHLDLVEIDNRVIELCQEYLPSLGGIAWEDPRLNIKIKDGVKWVMEAKDQSYDVIIVDGSDPKGPALGLFNKEFFQNCHRILKTGGVFATQSESPKTFLNIHLEMLTIIRQIFKYAEPLYGNVPIYPSGYWSWIFATKDKPRYLEPIPQRTEGIKTEFNIWSINWQRHAFKAMPAYLEKLINK